MIWGLSKKLIRDVCKEDLAIPVNETGGRSIHEDGIESIKNLIRRRIEFYGSVGFEEGKSEENPENTKIGDE